MLESQDSPTSLPHEYIQRRSLRFHELKREKTRQPEDIELAIQITLDNAS